MHLRQALLWDPDFSLLGMHSARQAVMATCGKRPVCLPGLHLELCPLAVASETARDECLCSMQADSQLQVCSYTHWSCPATGTCVDDWHVLIALRWRLFRAESPDQVGIHDHDACRRCQHDSVLSHQATAISTHVCTVGACSHAEAGMTGARERMCAPAGRL